MRVLVRRPGAGVRGVSPADSRAVLSAVPAVAEGAPEGAPEGTEAPSSDDDDVVDAEIVDEDEENK